jgi:hypothetical protein
MVGGGRDAGSELGCYTRCAFSLDVHWKLDTQKPGFADV